MFTCSSASNICGDEGNRKNGCKLCTATFSCAKFDAFTGKIKVEYKTPEVNILGGLTFTDPASGITEVGLLFFQ